MSKLNKYSLDDILSIWETDEKNRDDYKEKGYNTWREWRTDKMNKHGVDIYKWYKKSIKLEDVLEFRVGAFPLIYFYFEKFLNGDPYNYLKIKETKIKYYEKYYLKNKDKIDSIMLKLPKEINFIAWERNGEYILTEGHHRAIAIARLFKNNKGIKDIKLNLYYHPVIDKKLIKNIDFV